MRNDAQNFMFNALRNALYHTAQRKLFENRARWLNFLVVAFGTAALSDVLKPTGITAVHLGGFTALIGALQLTFDFSSRARTHQMLQHDYYQDLADFQRIPEPTESDIAQAQSRLTAIMANEPPTMKAVDAKAHNDAIDATGFYDQDQRLKVPLWHHFLRNFIGFEGKNYPTFEEIDARKQMALEAKKGKKSNVTAQ
ncbi:hypothetical protein [Phaeobacter inhibens]|uniref:hypothetical protein n=1 Tax=Phaeobacter inhibens TaxID=221822 RepID=UPI0021A6CFB1|nr:hypothetical protein [Phaeobacter inhibens]UWR97716.1 hypothetical protein K4K99_08015 [Phaeobacter inhibens]